MISAAEADDVDVGGDGEDQARLLQAPQVGHREQGDEDEAEPHPVLGQVGRRAETMAATPAEIDTATVRM